MKKRQLKNLSKKVGYLAGPTGCGPIDYLDKLRKPPPKLGRKEKEFMRKHRVVENLQKHLRGCFRQACIEVLGEDPDDWGGEFSPRESDAEP